MVLTKRSPNDDMDARGGPQRADEWKVARSVSEKCIPEQAVLALNLKRARELAGLSQQELADRAGLDRTYLSSLERGVGNPSLMKMASLSTALSMPVATLLMSENASGQLRGEAALSEIVAVLRRNDIIL